MKMLKVMDLIELQKLTVEGNVKDIKIALLALNIRLLDLELLALPALNTRLSEFKSALPALNTRLLALEIVELPSTRDLKLSLAPQEFNPTILEVQN
jgi:hypothetical protein